MPGLSEILTLPAPPADGDLGPLTPSQLPQEQTKPTSPSPTPPASIATHTKAIGVIHPPPDIKNIVDKTAQFVAKNGPEFEKRILANNTDNAKFNFLSPSDPYHAFYQHRILEYRNTLQTTSSTPAAPLYGNDTAKVAEFQFKQPVCAVLEPPEAEQYTVRLPARITGEELDIIKLTAQFVARNGKSFLTGVTSREITNPQFHFLP